MIYVTDFIRFALFHANAQSIPQGALLPVPIESCGIEPWHYLYGTTRSRTTRAKIEERWENYYKNSWTREAYDEATAHMNSTDYATDCQGLLDAYLTYELAVATDINSNMNYTNWCTSKGKIASITRPYVIGEALFIARTNGVMGHVGWVCGFEANGNPLVVEARGLRYGVVVTKFADRPWSHRGLMTNKFLYEEDIPMIQFKLTSPIQTGEAFKKMQGALNAAGYTDMSNNALTIDGKWGAKSQAAFEKLIEAHALVADEHSEFDATVFVSADGKTALAIKLMEV